MAGDDNHSPQLFSDYIFKYLDNALDFGISEAEFWDMTLAELERLTKSKLRVEKARAQEKATFDYILADLIGKSIGRMFSSSVTYPEISEVYPSLFEKEDMQEKKQEKKAELSALRFKHFAESYNKRFKEVQKKVE